MTNAMDGHDTIEGDLLEHEPMPHPRRLDDWSPTTGARGGSTTMATTTCRRRRTPQPERAASGSCGSASTRSCWRSAPCSCSPTSTRLRCCPAQSRPGATWGPTSGGPPSSATTCCPSCDCRAGHPTGTPASPPTSSTWWSRRCSSSPLDVGIFGGWTMLLPLAAGAALAAVAWRSGPGWRRRLAGQWCGRGRCSRRRPAVRHGLQARHHPRACSRCRSRRTPSVVWPTCPSRARPCSRSPPCRSCSTATSRSTAATSASTLAGEFAFSISLSLCVLYLGVVVRGLRTGQHRALAGGAPRAVRPVPPDPGLLRARRHRRHRRPAQARHEHRQVAGGGAPRRRVSSRRSGCCPSSGSGPT